MELLITILSNLPIAELLTHGVTTASAPGFIYDIGQAVLGLHLIAKGLVTVSNLTPWTWDDGAAKGFLGYTTSAVAWVGKHMGAYTAEKPPKAIEPPGK